MIKACALILFVSLLGQVGHSAAESPASKLTLRTGIEQLQNKGTSGGSASGGAGFEIGFYRFLTSRLALGLGYSASFDLKESTMPVSGYFLSGRVYFLRDGTQIQTEGAWGNFTEHQQWSPYFGLGFHKMKYFLGRDIEGALESDVLAGEYSNGVATIGIDARISEKFEWNLEGKYSAFTFASSDARIRIQHVGIFGGITYIF